MLFDVCSNTNPLPERYTSNLKHSVLEETAEQTAVDMFSWKSRTDSVSSTRRPRLTLYLVFLS